MFSVHTTLEEFENVKIAGHFGFVLKRKKKMKKLEQGNCGGHCF